MAIKKLKLHPGSACYLSVRRSLSYRLLNFGSKSTKLGIYFLFCMGWQSDLTLGGKHTDRTWSKRRVENITHWKALKFVVFISDKMTGDREDTACILKNLKVKLSLSRPWSHTTGEDVQLHLFLTSALDADEWSNSRSGRFTSGNESRHPVNALWIRVIYRKYQQ